MLGNPIRSVVVRQRLVIFLAVAAVLSFDRRRLGELASGLDDVERPCFPSSSEGGARAALGAGRRSFARRIRRGCTRRSDLGAA